MGIDYINMLRASIDSGSSLDASLRVLRNQSASIIECIKAVREVRNVSLEESKRLVLKSPAFAGHLECPESIIEQIGKLLDNK